MVTIHYPDTVMGYSYQVPTVSKKGEEETLEVKEKVHNKLANLIGLPIELHSMITDYLPRTDMIAWSRTSRLFDLPHPKLLWGELNLTMPINYAKLPLINPVAKRDDHHAYCVWLGKETKATEGRYRSALKSKLMTVLNKGDEEKWGYVKKVRMTTRHGSIPALAVVLEQVSPTMEYLELDGHVERFHEEPRGADTLDATLAGSGLTLPSLKHLKIGAQAISYKEFIPLLCGMSPSLQTIDIDYSVYPISLWNSLGIFDTFEGKTNIQSIKFAFVGKGCEHHRMLEENDAIHTLQELLRMSPKLEQMDLQYRGNSPHTLFSLVTVLGEHENLRDLYWPTTSRTVARLLAVNNPSPRFNNLRRLIIGSTTCLAPLLMHVEIPTLERLYLLPPPAKAALVPATTPISIPTGPQHMLPFFAAHIRANVNLKCIYTLDNDVKDVTDIFKHLDEMEKEDQVGNISSLKYGDEELLVATLWGDMVEVADILRTTKVVPKDRSRIKIPYPAVDGTLRQKIMERRSEKVLQTYTDFEGLVVPYEIIWEMKFAEFGGCHGSETWNGRGVEVKKDTWEILTKWRDGLKVEGTDVMEVEAEC